MTFINRREFVVSLAAAFAGCVSEKDMGVFNTERNLSELLTAQLKNLNLKTETLNVKVKKLREHTYQAEVEYNGKSIIIIIPPKPDIKGKVVDEILIELGIIQKKSDKKRLRRDNHIPKPVLI